MIFRNALPNEADVLTKLTLDSKKYWGYPEEWIAIWTDELTVHPKYIEKNMVVVAEEDKELLGYISVIEHNTKHVVKVGEYSISGGFFLDNLFISPSHINKGIGRKLSEIAFDWCRERQIKLLHVYSDPNAKGFYVKMGAVCLGEVISGDVGRPLPFLIFKL